jgi:hypothetical protein
VRLGGYGPERDLDLNDRDGVWSVDWRFLGVQEVSGA